MEAGPVIGAVAICDLVGVIGRLQPGSQWMDVTITRAKLLMIMRL